MAKQSKRSQHSVTLGGDANRILCSRARKLALQKRLALLWKGPGSRFRHLSRSELTRSAAWAKAVQGVRSENWGLGSHGGHNAKVVGKSQSLKSRPRKRPASACVPPKLCQDFSNDDSNLRCMVCSQKMEYEDATPLDRIVKDADHLKSLVLRFGRYGIPLLCASCTTRTTQAQQAMRGFEKTPLAKFFLCQKEAFVSRARGDGAFDNKGRLHPNIAYSKTCEWNCHEGRVADAARDAANSLPGGSSENSRISAAFRRYLYVPVEARARAASILNARMRGPSLQDGQSLHEYLNVLNTSSFMQPFYYILLLCMPRISKARREEARSRLARTWQTCHGGGKIINEVLFAKEKVVAETKSDFFASCAMPPSIQTERAVAFFGSFIFFSKFGAKLNAGDAMDEVIAMRLQRCLFRLCELRKANTKKPLEWHKNWLNRSARQSHSADHQIAPPLYA
eukprot:TRINITY_DN19752_c0_g1_i2.p1 TRINITY_DN19752_c0_g1~~TRINITY_DN19752_c0_g1_i2.p1  ORF type:complete len:461 (-),score=56.99 TRINITY_DN19752_c0_g1_i2:376-1731(-)